ncbi:unnamed protein product [Auanema sp. JU1783]|nr:unnamed protein product [Auanema sp. JU1783]
MINMTSQNQQQLFLGSAMNDSDNSLLRSHPNSASLSQRSNPLPTDHVLDLMNTVNSMVKNGQFTSLLASTVFQLCAQLKLSGQMLEQTHKNELNKVFVSLRQACCRDNGQLGTPCRLKIMELVELRAMYWRSNLAHSQYYVNRPENSNENNSTPVQSQSSQANTVSTAAAASTPQFIPQPMYLPQEMPTPAANPGFFLIPAGGAWMPPIMPSGTMIQQNPFMPQTMINPENLLMRQRSIKKQNSNPRSLQLRHEMIIRNSDSGKIMGVKGRRVALVEQLTNTVISFQKVDPKNKERTLTITASSAEDIEKAKELINETIRRNMSPSRADISSESSNSGQVNGNEDDYDDNDISIETTQDGMLKLCCSDPEVLQAAQEALSEYLRVRARPSAEEREKRKERRKSLPLQQTNNQTTSTLKPSRNFHGSTPNLADAIVPPNKGRTNHNHQTASSNGSKWSLKK